MKSRSETEQQRRQSLSRLVENKLAVEQVAKSHSFAQFIDKCSDI